MAHSSLAKSFGNFFRALEQSSAFFFGRLNLYFAKNLGGLIYLLYYLNARIFSRNFK